VSEPAEPEVRAAGGLVVREAEGGGTEVALVHRPKYDDWSLPKGKLDAGESFEGAALREVAEETGLRCEIGPELESTRYADRKGRDKLVRYFLMQPTGGEFKATDEVDGLRWLPPADAIALLDYEHDRHLVRGL
jgi:8-oxo-dGTP diphosphatase